MSPKHDCLCNTPHSPQAQATNYQTVGLSVSVQRSLLLLPAPHDVCLLWKVSKRGRERDRQIESEIVLLMAVCFSPIGCLLSCFLSRVSAGPRMRMQELRARQRGSKVNDGLDGEEMDRGEEKKREEERGEECL